MDFPWSKPKTDDEHRAADGVGAAVSGVDSASDTGTVATRAVDAARAGATDELNLSPRSKKRGRPPGGAKSGGADSQDLQTRIAAEIRSQLDALHSPESWGALLGAPSDVAVALTGRKYWEISETERKTLGMTGAAAARTFMITNPQGLALCMLAGALTSVYLPRFIKEMAHIRAERAKGKPPEEKKS